VVLEILGEVLVGPAVLGWVHVDGAVRVTPDLGLGFLLFMAGYEIDLRRFDRRVLWLAGRAFVVSAVLAVLVRLRAPARRPGQGRPAGGDHVDGDAARVLVPILNDADQTEIPFGRLILAAGLLAELAPLVLLSVFFSASSTNPPVELGLRAGLVGLTAVVVSNPADQGMGSVARGTAAAGGHQLPAAVRLAITIALAFSVAAEHFGPAATAVSPVMPARYRLPFLALARPLRTPDWWSTGVRLAQEARYAPVGNRVMSAPVSARASWAARRPQPGIESACCSCSSNGASSRSITLVGWSMSAVSRSMRASIFASSAACSAVKNSAPSSASSSSAILRRRGAG
jgi:hypothetical protein